MAYGWHLTFQILIWFLIWGGAFAEKRSIQQYLFIFIGVCGMQILETYDTTLDIRKEAIGKGVGEYTLVTDDKGNAHKKFVWIAPVSQEEGK